MECVVIARTTCTFLVPHGQENCLMKIFSAYKTILARELLTPEARNVLRLE